MATNHRLLRLRRQAYKRQHGLCIYCCCPMWEVDCPQFARAYGLTADLARGLQCTAEHLHARRDGGRNVKANIAAACLRCNLGRHAGRSQRAPCPVQYLSELLHRPIT